MLLGVRYHVRQRLWLRLSADLDAMFHTADNSRFTFYNGSWGVQGGTGMSLK